MGRTPRLCILALAVSLLAGCSVRPSDAPYRSGGDHIASIQSEAADTKWELTKAKTANGPAKDAHEESAFNHVTNIQQHASGAAIDFNDAAHQYGELVKKTDREHDANKWIGWQTRHLWYVFLSIWAIAGTIAIVAQFVGLGWLSAGIMRFLPFSNPFALVRDWIQKKKDANTPSVTVNIQNPEQVRAGAQQTVDAINAAGPATTPADAAAT